MIAHIPAARIAMIRIAMATVSSTVMAVKYQGTVSKHGFMAICVGWVHLRGLGWHGIWLHGNFDELKNCARGCNKQR
jgi:hypothetical protein